MDAVLRSEVTDVLDRAADSVGVSVVIAWCIAWETEREVLGGDE